MYWPALQWAYESTSANGVKGGPHAVLVALAYSMHPKTKKCFPSIARLAKLTHMSKSAVKAGLKILLDANLIGKTPGNDRRSNSYTIPCTPVAKKGAKAAVGVTPAKGPDSDPAKKEKGSDSNPDKGQIPSPNLKPCKLELLPLLVASSSNLEQPAGATTQPVAETVATKANTPIGHEAAFEVVSRYYEEDAQKTRRVSDSVKKTMSDALALFPDPDRSDVVQLDVLMTTVKIPEWDFFEGLYETCQSILEQMKKGRAISNMRGYFFASLRNRLEVTANVQKEIQRKIDELDRRWW